MRRLRDSSSYTYAAYQKLRVDYERARTALDGALTDLEQIMDANDSHMLVWIVEQYRAASNDQERVNVLVTAIGVYDGLLTRVEGQSGTLQAIADAEPATIMAHGYYEADCSGCQRLIAMAREGLEASG